MGRFPSAVAANEDGYFISMPGDHPDSVLVARILLPKIVDIIEDRYCCIGGRCDPDTGQASYTIQFNGHSPLETQAALFDAGVEKVRLAKLPKADIQRSDYAFIIAESDLPPFLKYELNAQRGNEVDPSRPRIPCRTHPFPQDCP